MAVNTANYNLKKPSQEDFYNIEDHNGNMDIIDTQIKRVETELEGHVGDTQSHVPHLGTTVNNGNTYTIDSEKTISDGSKFSVKFNEVATGTATLSISSDGLARSLKKPSGEDFKPKAGIYSFIRDGENFQLLGEGGEYGNVTQADVRSGITFGSDNGLSTGTLDTRALTWFRKSTWNKLSLGVKGRFCIIGDYIYFPSSISSTSITISKMYIPTGVITTDSASLSCTLTGTYSSYFFICIGTNFYIMDKSASNLYLYSTATKTLTAKTMQAWLNAGQSVGSDNNRYIVTTSISSSDWSDQFSLYDATTNSWTQIPKTGAISHITFCGLVFYNNNIVFLGGAYTTSSYRGVYSIDKTTGAITTLGLLVDYGPCTGVLVGTTIYVTGGYNPYNGDVTRVLSKFDLLTNTSTSLAAPTNIFYNVNSDWINYGLDYHSNTNSLLINGAYDTTGLYQGIYLI